MTPILGQNAADTVMNQERAYVKPVEIDKETSQLSQVQFYNCVIVLKFNSSNKTLRDLCSQHVNMSAISGVKRQSQMAKYYKTILLWWAMVLPQWRCGSLAVSSWNQRPFSRFHLGLSSRWSATNCRSHDFLWRPDALWCDTQWCGVLQPKKLACFDPGAVAWWGSPTSTKTHQINMKHVACKTAATVQFNCAVFSATKRCQQGLLPLGTLCHPVGGHPFVRHLCHWQCVGEGTVVFLVVEMDPI